MLRTIDDTRFWDRSARKYAATHIKDMPGYERTSERTRHFLNPSDTVLELGCGTGTTALKLAPFVGHIVGSDSSTEMVAIAREKATALGCENAEFTVAAAESGPDLVGSYDAVLAFNLLHLIADRQAAFARIHRFLKPGGLFISKTPCLSEMNPLIRIVVPLMRFAGQAPFVSFFAAPALEAEIADASFNVLDRERHGTGRKDPRIFIVARKSG
ncbi:class I SAM-dependent methyltransferase [Phreatobacter aquaticus]|uniref:Class I SAM-dependent methyltransferase n=1 Tax=Phreatobacter aquaticus TaxID=2570229 RepID=A0A4D7QT40_9HYPH|nr:class I SAM-dependent methyltransferase [Phreatobacter aquaticus]QCK87212.1 class I SAM-dependent methyltransferase [Phreatobacter aquaticus]